jgi:hypothetical protein
MTIEGKGLENSLNDRTECYNVIADKNGHKSTLGSKE